MARGILRKILGAYLDISPKEILFSYNHYGKPTLNVVADKHSLCFNITHSEEIALFAVTRRQEIGIDLEFIKKEMADTKVAENFCSQDELSELNKLSANLYVSAFFSFWTRKEAFLKAAGTGLSYSLKKITLPMILQNRENRFNRNKHYRIRENVDNDDSFKFRLFRFIGGERRDSDS